MAIYSSQIGWSQEAKLINQLIKQTVKLNNQFSTNQPGFRISVSRQIGWSNECNLYYEWLKQLTKFTAHVADCCTPPTTTTTTTMAPGDVGIPPSVDFDIVGDFTIEFWMKMANPDGFPRVYSFGSYPAPNAISIEGGGTTLYFWAGLPFPLLNAVPTGGFVGIWRHVAIMRSSGTVGIYIDGVLEASTVYAADIPSGGLPLTIGFGNEPNSYFNGYLASFRWNTTAVYNPAGFTVPTAPLPNIANDILLIFEGTNVPMLLSDLSGNGHNATNSGANYSADNPFTPSVPGSLQVGSV